MASNYVTMLKASKYKIYKLNFRVALIEIIYLNFSMAWNLLNDVSKLIIQY